MDYFPAVFGGRRANIALHVSDGFAVSLSAGRTIQKFRLGFKLRGHRRTRFLQSCCPASQSPRCTVSQGWSAPHSGLCICLFWTWWSFGWSYLQLLSSLWAVALHSNSPPLCVVCKSVESTVTLCRSESPSPLSALAGLSSSGSVYVLPQTLRSYGNEWHPCAHLFRFHMCVIPVLCSWQV